MSPCTSESSFTDSLISGSRSGIAAEQFTDWDNLLNGASNQDTPGRRAAPLNGASAEQPRQSVLQVNSSRKPTKSPLAGQPPPEKSSVASTSHHSAGDQSKSFIVERNIGEFTEGTKRQRLSHSNNASLHEPGRNENEETPEPADEHTEKLVPEPKPVPEVVSNIPPTIRRDPSINASSHAANRNHRKELHGPKDEKTAKSVRPEQQIQSAKKTPLMVRRDPPIVTPPAAPMPSTGGKRGSNDSEPQSTESSSQSDTSTVSFEGSAARIESQTQKPPAQKPKTPTSTGGRRLVSVNMMPPSSAQTNSGSRAPNQAMASNERNRKISTSSTYSFDSSGEDKPTELAESDPFADPMDPFADFDRIPKVNARKRSLNNGPNPNDDAKKPKSSAQRAEDNNADMQSSNDVYLFTDDDLQFPNEDNAMIEPDYQYFSDGGGGDDFGAAFDDQAFNNDTSFKLDGNSFDFEPNNGNAIGFADFGI